MKQMSRWRVVLVVGLFSLLTACRATNGDAAVSTDTPVPQVTQNNAEIPPAETATSPAPSSKATSSPALADPTATRVVATAPPEDSALQEEGAAESLSLPQMTFAQFPGAGSIDFTVTGEGRLYVAYGQSNNVYVTQSEDRGGTFGEAVVASQEGNVFVYGLERPAIAMGAGGRIYVGWPEDSYPGRIWYAVSDDDGVSFGPSLPLSEVGPETVLVRFVLEPDGSPIAAWLQDRQLHFTRTGDDGTSFLSDRVIDNQTCDCCHPQPLWLNGELLIAYRNLVIEDDGRQIRDIYLVKSPDGGDTFVEPVRVSDEPWYIAACPFSGPTLVSDGEQTLFVSWMDGRNDVQGNFRQTDIWLATSADGGQTFSANRRINETTGVYNNLPSLAREESGRLHILWQAEDSERGVLYYTASADNGQTFAPATVLVDSEGDRRKRPTNASLFVDEAGVVYASWVDGDGGYLATWQGLEEVDG